MAMKCEKNKLLAWEARLAKETEQEKQVFFCN